MRSLLLGVFLICSFSIHATNNAEVALWTQQTLLNTFSIDHNYQDSELPKYRTRFTQNSWNAISDFLGDYLQVIRDKKLTLHPVFLIKPTVVDNGDASGIRYWRVNEELLFPEIKMKVAFSLIVIATEHGYLIQSLDMVKEEKP